MIMKLRNATRRTYKWLTEAPTFPFGYGLHYTNFSTSLTTPSINTFNISSLVQPTTNTTKYADLTPFLTLPITVSNTGSTNSSYVALAFLSGTFGPTPYPSKSLVAYTRLHDITSNSSQKGTLNLTLGSLARTDENGDLVLYPGSYRLGIDVNGEVGWNFTLEGEKVVLDSWPARPAFVSPGNATTAR
jgi:beta-D-xylosidase 4